MAAKKLTRRQIIDSMIHKANSDAGHKVLARACDVPNPFFLRRPSGIMSLDIQTGGGIPAGGWVSIVGPEGAGKNYLLTKYMAYNQMLYGEDSASMLACAEFLPDYFFLRRCGLQVAIPKPMIEEKNEWRRARGLPAFTKQQVKEFQTQVGDVIICRGATGEETLNMVLEAYGSKAFGIIGLDSVNALEAKAEVIVDDLEKNPQQRAMASLMTKFSRKYHPLTLGLDDDVNETTLVMLGQVRSNASKAAAPAFMAKFMKDWASGGAYAMRHAKLMEICISPGSKMWPKKSKSKGAGKDSDDEPNTKDRLEPIGKIMQWELLKGKAGTHEGRRGEVEFRFDTLVDDVQTILDAGLQCGVITETDKGFAITSAVTGETITEALPSLEMLHDELRQDFKAQISLRMEVLAAHGVECRYI